MKKPSRVVLEGFLVFVRLIGIQLIPVFALVINNLQMSFL